MITDSFDNKTSPIISLKDFYGKQKHIVDVCMIVFSKVIFDCVLAIYPCEEIAVMEACNGESPIYKFNQAGKDIAIYLSALGSTSAAQQCIECNWLTGATKFVMFGSAGSLNSKMTTGRFVVPTEAYRDEGLSYHYAPPTDYIAIRNHSRTAEFLGELGIPYVEGRIWTTDAMLRETTGQVKARQEEGCLAVEMEVAGVQSVCDFYGFELFVFLVTGDVLSLTDYNKEGLKTRIMIWANLSSDWRSQKDYDRRVFSGLHIIIRVV